MLPHGHIVFVVGNGDLVWLIFINLRFDIRDILIRTARRQPPPGNGWHDRYGFGRVSASAAVAAVAGGEDGGEGGTESAAGKRPAKRTGRKRKTAEREKRSRTRD